MADGVYELALHGHDGSGNQWVNVFHYQCTGTVGHSNVQAAGALISAWIAGVQTAFLACCPSDILLRQISARNVSAAHSGTSTSVPGPMNGGTRPSNSASLNIGPQIAWYGSIDSRQVGKTFLPGIPLADVNEGVMSTGLTDAIKTFMDTAVTHIAIGGDFPLEGDLCIFKRSTKTGTIIDHGESRVRLGSQRRRTVPVF